MPSHSALFCNIVCLFVCFLSSLFLFVGIWARISMIINDNKSQTKEMK